MSQGAVGMLLAIILGGETEEGYGRRIKDARNQNGKEKAV